jgi:hypothetical protein
METGFNVHELAHGRGMVDAIPIALKIPEKGEQTAQACDIAGLFT